jgi:cytochrome bd-type quinol oxidase subunit 2
MSGSDLVGLPIPDSGLVFATALSVHIVSGLTAVTAGALAAAARKRAGRHPCAGCVYLYALSGVLATATVMAIIRWREDTHLLAVAVIAFSLALYGYRARRRHRPAWPPHHAIGMGGSYIALLTGFYVDNGPFLPLWNQLPHLTYWLLPSVVGGPLVWLALRRFRRDPRTDSTGHRPAREPRPCVR